MLINDPESKFGVAAPNALPFAPSDPSRAAALHRLEAECFGLFTDLINRAIECELPGAHRDRVVVVLTRLRGDTVEWYSVLGKF